LETLKTSTSVLLKLENSVIDFCGDYYNACLPHVVKLLRKALGERVKLIAVKPVVNQVVRQNTF
jgi:hypothetical protein